MELDQAQMHQISKSEQSNNKENVVLRALVADPNRHKPLVKHPPPTTINSEDGIPAAMYTVETRYRPIPRSALPNSSEPKLYYIGSSKSEQPIASSPPIMKDERDTPVPAEPEVLKNVEQEPVPVVFLEPKIISQPILYSIVAAKNPPTPKDEPIPITKEMPSPILYTIIGQPDRPTTDISESAINVETPVIDKTPILYSVVASPRLQVQPESIKRASETSEQLPPSIYAVVGSPHLQPQMQEPVQQPLSLPQQPSPSLYSIVGRPILTPPITQANRINASPSTQPIKGSSMEQAPLLYTILGETRVPTDMLNENHSSSASVKKQTNDITMARTIGDSNIPLSMAPPRKTKPVPPQKQQEPHPQTPTLYTVIGKPTSPSQKNLTAPLKPPVRRKTPLSAIVPTQRMSRSLERPLASEPTNDEITSMPPVKTRRQTKSKEPTIPKSETVFMPLSEQLRLPPRPRQKPRTAPWKRSPETTHRTAFNIAHYDPFHTPDYISPYAYHPSKPYRERTYNPVSLPPLTNNHSGHKSRLPLYESSYRYGQKSPYDPWTYHSLERHPVNSKQRSRVWDYEDEAQTDIDYDDDDDPNNLDSFRKRRRYRRFRPRTPWIPVW